MDVRSLCTAMGMVTVSRRLLVRKRLVQCKVNVGSPIGPQHIVHGGSKYVVNGFRGRLCFWW